MRLGGHSIPLVLHGRDRVAALSHPLHHHDECHHRRLGIAPSQQPSQFSVCGGVSHPALGAAPDVRRQFSALVSCGAEHRAPAAAHRACARPPASIRSVAAGGVYSPVAAPDANRASAVERLCGDLAGGMVRLDAVDSLLFSSSQPGHAHGQPGHPPIEQFGPGIRHGQPAVRPLAAGCERAVQPQRLVLDGMHGAPEPMGDAAAVRVSVCAPPVGSALHRLLRPSVGHSQRLVPCSGAPALGAGTAGVRDGLLCLAVANCAADRHSYRHSFERRPMRTLPWPVLRTGPARRYRKRPVRRPGYQAFLARAGPKPSAAPGADPWRCPPYRRRRIDSRLVLRQANLRQPAPVSLRGLPALHCGLRPLAAKSPSAGSRRAVRPLDGIAPGRGSQVLPG